MAEHINSPCQSFDLLVPDVPSRLFSNLTPMQGQHCCDVLLNVDSHAAEAIEAM